MKHLKKINENENFDWQEWDDTDIAGAAIQIITEEFINEVNSRLNKSLEFGYEDEFTYRLRKQAANTLKRYIVNMINDGVK
jgi:hypothetical protein